MSGLDWIVLTIAIATGTWASRFIPNLVSKAIALTTAGAAKVAKMADDHDDEED